MWNLNIVDCSDLSHTCPGCCKTFLLFSFNDPLTPDSLKYWTTLMAIGPACFSKKGWVSQACFVRGPGAVIGSTEGLFSEAAHWLCVLTFLSSVPRLSYLVSVGIWKLLHLWLWCYIKNWEIERGFYSVYLNTGAFRCLFWGCERFALLLFKVQTWNLCKRHTYELNFEQQVSTLNPLIGRSGALRPPS